ncbi:family 20 glycosylhydrolase [Niabella hirudinis]|uniref:family 20 glycosylhydrolase n=1 Tax=Niabella hirudinis TaxID=1285929 RepID=UPI003EB841BC
MNDYICIKIPGSGRSAAARLAYRCRTCFRRYTVFLLYTLLCACSSAAGDSTPALIPLPQELQWKQDHFDLSKAAAIYVSSKELEPVVTRSRPAALKQLRIKTGSPAPNETGYIFIGLDVLPAPYQAEEAYQVRSSASGVRLIANTAHGVFNGLQTLAQLVRNNRISGCIIKDYPAFSWRGYMVDVGRNFQSVGQLKQQIDKMAAYKLNIFHFHLTENVAWRLQIRKYPALTAAANMTRNKGDYYSVADIKELIRYCRERFITLVPEIDMPGHSEAFARAMKTGMQSEQGTAIMKNILREICTTYDIPYIHIGVDEVAITNKDFVPEVEALLDSCEKKVIAWNPGEAKSSTTIQHLWKAGDQHYKNDTIGKYIDSRFLYISDMDPQNTVVTIFNRRFFEQERGNKNLLGAEICLWSDRRVVHQKDLLVQNTVYPALLAFAERSWRGGGYDGVSFAIGAGKPERIKDFEAFEQRLLDHKKNYFGALPFNYVKQTGIRWKLLGPFKNDGDLGRSFWPEQQEASLKDSAGIPATGGTVWLWPTHYPLTAGWLPDPQTQTTWYAYTRFLSPVSGTIDFWLDTKDQSKSGADATPPNGEWDYNKSKIWINRQLINPPVFQFAGRKSGLLEEPLVDEMYYIRPPRKIKVQKGWNHILVKLPADQFDPLKDWQVPPKLMFTIIPLKHTRDGLNQEAMDWLFAPGKLRTVPAR